jgi:hypothetical protein
MKIEIKKRQQSARKAAAAKTRKNSTKTGSSHARKHQQ